MHTSVVQEAYRSIQLAKRNIFVNVTQDFGVFLKKTDYLQNTALAGYIDETF